MKRKIYSLLLVFILVFGMVATINPTSVAAKSSEEIFHSTDICPDGHNCHEDGHVDDHIDDFEELDVLSLGAMTASVSEMKDATLTAICIIHNYSVTKAATCTVAGTKKCSKCGTTQSIPATGHSYGSWTTTKSPTCASSGSKKRSCSRCGASETQTIPKTGTHSYAAATCISPKKCTTCLATSGSALGHNYNVVTKAATCKATGTKRCSRCTATQTIPKTGTHSYTAATCTSPKKCKTCGATSGSTLGHNFSVVTKAATCKATGTKRCSRCTVTQTIPKTGTHSYAAATCTSPKKCKTCGTTSGSALGHNFSVVTKAATCTATGTKKCSRCTATQTIPSLGHNYDLNNKCKRCSAVFVPAIGVTIGGNSTNNKLAIGKTHILTATVSPSNATNKTVTWSSNDDRDLFRHS